MRLIDADYITEDRVSNDLVVIAAKCAPTIDAIHVEWIKALTNHSDMFTRGSAKWVLRCWKKEQEAR